MAVGACDRLSSQLNGDVPAQARYSYRHDDPEERGLARILLPYLEHMPTAPTENSIGLTHRRNVSSIAVGVFGRFLPIPFPFRATKVSGMSYRTTMVLMARSPMLPTFFTRRKVTAANLARSVKEKGPPESGPFLVHLPVVADWMGFGVVRS